VGRLALVNGDFDEPPRSDRRRPAQAVNPYPRYRIRPDPRSSVRGDGVETAVRFPERRERGESGDWRGDRRLRRRISRGGPGRRQPVRERVGSPAHARTRLGPVGPGASDRGRRRRPASAGSTARSAGAASAVSSPADRETDGSSCHLHSPLPQRRGAGPPCWRKCSELAAGESARYSPTERDDLPRRGRSQPQPSVAARSRRPPDRTRRTRRATSPRGDQPRSGAHDSPSATRPTPTTGEQSAPRPIQNISYRAI
jgi:hypothetical protein